MASYTTRIQLLGNPSEADYEKLHAAMEARNFSRNITSDGGTTYKLPQAEYNFSGSLTRADVLNLAAEAAQTVSVGAKILITESVGRSWRNLESI
jgi:hypothetical protein